MFTQFCSRISSSKAFFCISPAQKLLLSHFPTIIETNLKSSSRFYRDVTQVFGYNARWAAYSSSWEKRRMLHSVLIDLLIYIFYRLVRVIVQLESDLFLLGRKLLKSDQIYEETGKPVVEILNIIARRDIFN